MKIITIPKPQMVKSMLSNGERTESEMEFKDFVQDMIDLYGDSQKTPKQARQSAKIAVKLEECDKELRLQDEEFLIVKGAMDAPTPTRAGLKRQLIPFFDALEEENIQEVDD